MTPEQVKQIIIHHGTKADLARELSVQWVTVHRWVRGERKPQGTALMMLKRMYNEIKSK